MSEDETFCRYCGAIVPIEDIDLASQEHSFGKCLPDYFDREEC